MKKKVLALTLVLMMLLPTLAACGAPASNDPGSGNTQPAGTPAGETTGNPEHSPAGDPVTLKVACFKGENDFMCQQLLKVCQYVEENSGGSIKFEYWLGGSFCTMVEEFGYLSDGAIDMCALMEGAGQAANMLNLFQFSRTHDSCAEAVAICNELLNENETTSPLLLGQAAEHNILPLGYSIAGVDAFCATSPIDSLASMSSLSFGCSRDQALFEAMGLNVISMDSNDAYESLSRGMVDATSIPVSAMVAGKLYEVAPYVLVSLSGGCSGMPCLNLDTWNKLTAEQQQLFRDGYAAAAAWAAEEYDNILKNDVAEMESNGATVAYMSAADDQTKKNITAQSTWNTASAVADGLGNLEDFTVIFDAAATAVGASYSK